MKFPCKHFRQLSSFFEKKQEKVLAVPKKSITFASAFREMHEKNAEIAQLVEHNLAKVGVAGPSPVFRSHVETKEVKNVDSHILNAQVAELVDAHVSGACAARRAGSSPVLGTLFFRVIYMLERWRNW